MKNIKKFDEIINAWRKGEKQEVDHAELAVIDAYRDSLEADSETINFNNVIWDKDVEGMVKVMRELGIGYFTITSTFSGLLETIAEFEKHGCKLEGMTISTTRYTDFVTGEHEIKPAVKINL